MIITVSISDLRNNIASYIEKVTKGNRVIVRDDKRGVNVAEIVQTPTFDKNAYEKILRKAAGLFSSEKHPEWKTQPDVINWVSSNRHSDERSF